jgi:hypothetical protein
MGYKSTHIYTKSIYIYMVGGLKHKSNNYVLVGGLEHEFYVSIYWE